MGIEIETIVRKVAKTCAIRAYDDAVARPGGDEGVVVGPPPSRADFKSLAKELGRAATRAEKTAFSVAFDDAQEEYIWELDARYGGIG